ncbi:type II toxin-antitoxin system VapC family toxin [Vulcanisaeta sp. JCM 16161]|uniref:type II toxin-antitoxin system VapC family toxin n=1 Tax=Vulcanisaeta sp. JCM 16161 TaxID=1295372 RepID=UPI00406C4EDC
MYLIDANIFLEVIYRRDKWAECYEFLNRVKKGDIRAYALHFTIHAISAILGKPDLVSKFLSEISTWRGLVIIDSPVDEEAMAAELAFKVGLDFDDGLHYYYAKKIGLKLISFDKDFDKTDIKRLEPRDVLRTS